MNPVLGCNFQVSLLDSQTSFMSAGTITLSQALSYPVIGFNECTGLEMALEVFEYNQGGGNDGTLKFPTRAKPSTLVLKRGLTTNESLWKWFYSFIQGAGKRRDGMISVHDAAQGQVMVWGFRRGIPTKYSGPQLNAVQSAVAVESLEISHEGLYTLGGAAGFATALSNAAGALASLANG
ncbi:MAG: phage tail protein [Kofleriaceae bacterium]